jgi:hypothetical protein
MFKFCWHKYKDIKTQQIKGMLFGIDGGLPAQRVVQECVKCGKIRYIKLNMCMPDEYLYRENLWR